MLGVHVGLSTLVINYRNQKGVLVTEVLTFDGHLVTHGHEPIWAATPTRQGQLPAERP